MTLGKMEKRLIEDLELLRKLDSIDLYEEFCKLSLHILKHGSSGVKVKARRAAKQLNTQEEKVEDVLVGLSMLFLTGRRNSLSQAKFNAYLNDLNLPEKAVASVSEFYVRNFDTLGEALQAQQEKETVSGSIPRYHNMQWRLEVEIASRASSKKPEPNFTIKFDTDQGSKLFRCDYATFTRIREDMRMAMEETKSVHTQRVMRYIK